VTFLLPVRSFAWFLAAILPLGVASCSGNPRPVIVGKWLTPRAETVEFKADGAVTLSRFRNPLFTGSYRWLDDQTLEIDGESFGKHTVSRLHIVPHGNALLVTAENGPPEQFTRAP
jgi:hypothetical protein